MRSKGHYEMREYSIDMLEEEEEHHAQLERRPYPLYPSKAGLKQSFRDVISRLFLSAIIIIAITIIAVSVHLVCAMKDCQE